MMGQPFLRLRLMAASQDKFLRHSWYAQHATAEAAGHRGLTRLARFTTKRGVKSFALSYRATVHQPLIYKNRSRQRS